MHSDTPAQIYTALLVGEEIFAIAALWPLSEWAVARSRGAWFALSLAFALGCFGLYGYAMRALSSAAPGDTTRLDVLLATIALPLFLAFPDVVCVASAQSLRLAGASPNVARAVSLAVAALAVAVAPIAAIAAGCGLAGMCA